MLSIIKIENEKYLKVKSMAVQIYTFKITYADCDNKIWRIAAVSSNYTLAELGYMVLASFDTMAYHLFEMKYKDTSFFISAECFEDLQYNDNNDYDMLSSHKINSVNMNIGETIEMIYDFGCEQIFNIELIEISDMPASELLKAINTNHSLNYGNLSPQKPYIKAFAAISSP